MKTLISLMTLFYCLTALAQTYTEFKPSSEYTLTEIDSSLIQEYWFEKPEGELKPIPIYLLDRDGKKILEIDIEGPEFYDETVVEQLDVTGLSNIESVIHLISKYNACCSNYYSTFLLKTKSGNYVELPMIDNLYCDGAVPFKEYRFPGQEFGIDNSIILTKSTPDLDDKVNSVEVLVKYYFDGKKLIIQD